MKIVTWNCQGALRKKTETADSLNADILIIQECEDPSKSTLTYKDWAGEYLWTGKSKNKGIGIFSRTGRAITHCNWAGEFKIGGINSNHPAAQWTTSDLELFLPCLIDNRITVLAVWTKQAASPIFGHIGQFWKYLQIHRTDLANEKTITIGDFNSSSIWDKKDRWWNHSDVVNELEKIGLKSLYHSQFNEEQGRENTPTFYMYRKPEKPFHIDYAFMSGDLLDKSKLTIGPKSEWLEYSDHMPLIVDIATE
ncbi:MAG: endonuclease/exonuclease/phosphatase family protein [Pseudodesulfovibrio sp.]|uniref:endonuclease/exonuclease/phosphatase family protein n=1 Tax=Pseudodesulfovibrio sp. TaxID=2035812 RepID=UPI003D149345